MCFIPSLEEAKRGASQTVCLDPADKTFNHSGIRLHCEIKPLWLNGAARSAHVMESSQDETNKTLLFKATVHSLSQLHQRIYPCQNIPLNYPLWPCLQCDGNTVSVLHCYAPPCPEILPGRTRACWLCREYNWGISQCCNCSVTLVLKQHMWTTGLRTQEALLFICGSSNSSESLRNLLYTLFSLPQR